LRAGRIVDGFHALGVLYRKGRDGGYAVTAVGGKRFEIRNDSAAATRIKSPNGQQNGWGSDALNMKMAHDYLYTLALREENSRTRFAWHALSSTAHQKTPGTCECTRTNFSLQGVFHSWGGLDGQAAGNCEFGK